METPGQLSGEINTLASTDVHPWGAEVSAQAERKQLLGTGAKAGRPTLPTPRIWASLNQRRSRRGRLPNFRCGGNATSVTIPSFTPSGAVQSGIIRPLRQKPIMTIEIHGFCDKRFQPLTDAFAANSTTASRSARRWQRRDTAGWWSTCGRAMRSQTTRVPGDRT